MELANVGTEDGIQQASMAPVVGDAVQKREVILLVEDDEAVRSLSRTVLVRRGYAVMTAPDGPSALNLAADHSATIDLLVTDVTMPAMSGYRLADVLSELRPGLRVLFVSGYAPEPAATWSPTRRGRGFLPKPFTIDTLAQTVRDLLDGPPPRPEEADTALDPEASRALG